MNNEIPVVTVGGLITSSDDQILVVTSHKWPNKYSLPGGKVKLGEKRVDAFIREMKEETGLDVVSPKFAMVQECIHSTEFWKPNTHFVMNDFIAKIPADEKQTVQLNEELQIHLWISPAEAMKLDLTIPTKKLIEWFMKQMLYQGWKIVEEKQLERSYKFPDFKSALAFTNQVGALAESANHHPEIELTWGSVKLIITTHDHAGLTEKDYNLAAKIDLLK